VGHLEADILGANTKRVLKSTKLDTPTCKVIGFLPKIWQRSWRIIMKFHSDLFGWEYVWRNFADEKGGRAVTDSGEEEGKLDNAFYPG
jgi:hypothetical protein